MVWETRKVCDETNHSWFVSFHLLPLPLINLQNASGHVPPTYTSQKTPLPHDVNAYPSLHGTRHTTPRVRSHEVETPNTRLYCPTWAQTQRRHNPQLTSPPSPPESARRAKPRGFDQGNHQYLTLALMASTNSTMSPSNNARTDANDAHRRTNDGDNDVLGWTLSGLHHPHDLPNLAALHGDVN